ncbi:ABCA2 [Symbiodinium natans]|uniref:ABCA2 protein n=1 Tax=Symbiodinium natans TaxID=878477 RepID=A0A812QCP3_9DINO|nr:ABCA2 [Symbiodinium natans]
MGCFYDSFGHGFYASASSVNGTGELCLTRCADPESLACRVNGFFKLVDSLTECRLTCDAREACIGYTFMPQADSQSFANTCYVHVSNTSELPEIPEGWARYPQMYANIAGTSGSSAAMCYRVQVRDPSLPTQRGCYFREEGGSRCGHAPATSWTLDLWGTEHWLSDTEATCLARKGSHDIACLTNSSWLFVPWSAEVPPVTTRAVSEHLTWLMIQEILKSSGLSRCRRVPLSVVPEVEGRGDGRRRRRGDRRLQSQAMRFINSYLSERKVLVAPYTGEVKEVINMALVEGIIGAFEDGTSGQKEAVLPGILGLLSKCPLVRGAMAGSALDMAADQFMFFDAREEMEDFARRQPDEVLMAIEFRSANANGDFPEDHMDAEFSIRVNAQLLPSTSRILRSECLLNLPIWAFVLAPTMASSKRVVAVTGCTRGIGRALLQWFAKEHHAAGCGTAQAELELLRRAHPEAVIGEVNVRQEEDLRRWLGSIAEKWGRLDMLVACAGAMPSQGSVWETPEEEWQRACDVNVLGTVRALRHAVPLMKPGSLIVLVSSRYGRSVVTGKGCYSATKWAVEAIGKTLALELRSAQIAAVTLDPGVVNTEMLRQSCSSEEEVAWCQEQRSVEDFAAATGPFLLSLGMEDTGRNLVAPGCPESYYETGVAYKDRPAWANGFGPFRPAREDIAEPARKRSRAAANGGPRRYFISGVMLGSRKKLKEEEGLLPQNYRQQIADALLKADPEAVIVDPLEAVQARAARSGATIADWNKDDAAVRSAFNEVVDMVKECDVIVSNLPEASMGSAVELWEARRAGLLVLTISPMADNWMLRSVTDTWVLIPLLESGPRLPDRLKRADEVIGSAAARFQAIREARKSGSLTVVGQHSAANLRTEPGRRLRVMLEQFPLPLIEVDNFIGIIQFMMPMFLVLGWIYAVSLMVREIVYEKQEHLRDVMRIQGLKTWVYWLSWFMSGMAQLTGLVVILTMLLSLGAVLEHSDFSVLFVFYWVYSVSTVSFAMFISSFFSRAKVAAAFAGLIYWMAYMPYALYQAYEESMSYGAKNAMCLMSPTALGVGMLYVGKWEIVKEGVQWHNLFVPPGAWMQYRAPAGG